MSKIKKEVYNTNLKKLNESFSLLQSECKELSENFNTSKFNFKDLEDSIRLLSCYFVFFAEVERTFGSDKIEILSYKNLKFGDKGYFEILEALYAIHKEVENLEHNMGKHLSKYIFENEILSFDNFNSPLRDIEDVIFGIEDRQWYDGVFYTVNHILEDGYYFDTDKLTPEHLDKIKRKDIKSGSYYYLLPKKEEILELYKYACYFPKDEKDAIHYIYTKYPIE